MSQLRFTTPLLTPECVKNCKAGNIKFRLVGLLGGYATSELVDIFLRAGENPRDFPAWMRGIRSRWAAEVGRVDWIFRNMRVRHPGTVGNATSERAWLKLADELVARADALVEMWELTGGPRAIERENSPEKTEPAPAAAQAIEIHPVFNIEVHQPKVEGPAEVRVVSMPTRSTRTEIERDELGAIIASKQTEQDAA